LIYSDIAIVPFVYYPEMFTHDRECMRLIKWGTLFFSPDEGMGKFEKRTEKMISRSKPQEIMVIF
jgi:hypothetical protein